MDNPIIIVAFLPLPLPKFQLFLHVIDVYMVVGCGIDDNHSKWNRIINSKSIQHHFDINNIFAIAKWFGCRNTQLHTLWIKFFKCFANVLFSAFAIICVDAFFLSFVIDHE